MRVGRAEHGGERTGGFRELGGGGSRRRRECEAEGTKGEEKWDEGN
jgi:hypothetical protein